MFQISLIWDKYLPATSTRIEVLKDSTDLQTRRSVCPQEMIITFNWGRLEAAPAPLIRR